VPPIVLLVVLSEELGDREVAPFDPNASCFANGLKVGGADNEVRDIGRFDSSGIRLEFTLVEVFYEMNINNDSHK
jgi:hypothetical protein